VLALHEKEIGDASARPYDIYATLDLGPGGYTAASARSGRGAIADVIRKRHPR
jgi:hypothetical protein